MESIVQAPNAYGRLDDPKSNVRIRLKSTVVRVEHDSSIRSGQAAPDRAQMVRVAYRRDGKTHGVRGRRVILACYNSLIPSLVPELPAKQKEALAYSIKVPMMYNTVLLRRWTAFQKLGVNSINAPGMYHTSVSLDPGTKIGGYSGVTTPDEPILVHMVRNPNSSSWRSGGSWDGCSPAADSIPPATLSGSPSTDGRTGTPTRTTPSAIRTSLLRNGRTSSAAGGLAGSRFRTRTREPGRSPIRRSMKPTAQSRSCSWPRDWHEQET
jgi:hypothetical protein